MTVQTLLGSLSNNVFERRTSTGSGLFSFFDGGFAQIFSQIASITVKKLRNTNFISSRHVKRENTSLPVDVRRSKTSLLKLPIKRGDLHTLVYRRILNCIQSNLSTTATLETEESGRYGQVRGTIYDNFFIRVYNMFIVLSLCLLYLY